MLQVLAYGDALKELENAGEVNIKLSMHNLDRSDESKKCASGHKRRFALFLTSPRIIRKRRPAVLKQRLQNRGLRFLATHWSPLPNESTDLILGGMFTVQYLCL